MRIIDLQAGKELAKPLQHSVGVTALRLEQGGNSFETNLAIIDKNNSVLLASNPPPSLSLG